MSGTGEQGGTGSSVGRGAGPDVIGEWHSVTVPPPPEVQAVKVTPETTALLILDIQDQNCSLERRPRCVASLPGIRALLAKARHTGMAVVYSLTSKAEPADVREEVAPRPGEPVVKAGVDKFHGTELAHILTGKNVNTVILVGTSANGAVLHTTAGAALRGLRVVVPVDGMSATEPYA